MTSNIVWVTGAAGLIGSELVRHAQAVPGGFSVVGLARADLDLTDFRAVRKRFEAEQPVGILHCAALSRSPACDADPVLAQRVNVEATRYLSELSCDLRFLFFSTDLVFDGRKGSYLEEDEVHPLTVYAETKVQAERVVRGHPKHQIIRTSLNYGHSLTADRAFNEDMVNAWRAGKTLKLFTDEFRCPLSVSITAAAAWELFRLGESGIWHVAGTERLSRWQIGELLAKRHPRLKPRMEPSSVKTFSGPPRSPDVALDSSKARSRLSTELPKFSVWLDQHEPCG